MGVCKIYEKLPRTANTIFPSARGSKNIFTSYTHDISRLVDFLNQLTHMSRLVYQMFNNTDALYNGGGPKKKALPAATSPEEATPGGTPTTLTLAAHTTTSPGAECPAPESRPTLGSHLGRLPILQSCSKKRQISGPGAGCLQWNNAYF